MTDSQTQLDNLQRQIDLLTKMVPKAKLARHMPQEDFGQTIRVSTYRTSSEDEPRLVVGWSLISDYVKTKRNGEIDVDQMVLLHLDGDYELLDRLKAKRKILVVQEKVDANEVAIATMEADLFLRIKLEDFGSDLEKVTVQVDTEKTKYDRNGQPTEFFFTLNGEEKSLQSTYVN